MGSAILPHLIRGCGSVTVWNRTHKKTAEAELLGAHVATSPRALVQQSDIILSILYDDAAVEQVYLGSSGLLEENCAGRVFVEMSTIRSDTVQNLANAVSLRNAILIDAPVSGSVGPAREGKLLALVGGPTAAFERASPIMKLFSRRIVHLGPIGSGMAMKLGIQSLIYIYWQALGEALAIGAKSGITIGTMLEIISDSPAALAALKSKIPAISGSDQDVSFPLSAAAKDLDVILSAGRFLGLSSPLKKETLECYQQAMRAGRGEKDIAAIVPFALSSAGGSNG
jgi:3-hydroxyisobutyrate dehydrogenase-like beta-hydroxyacid dehydrogenase